MEHILDDNKDHIKVREEKLINRRKVFRVLIFIFPLFFAAYSAFFDGRPGERLEKFFSIYVGALMIFGLFGLIIGSVLSWLIWKDITAKIRWGYLVSISTLVIHSLILFMVISNLVFMLLGWI